MSDERLSPIMTVSLGKKSGISEKQEMCIRDSKADRANLEPDDIVKVKGGKAESGKIPAREADLHRHIYKTHPEVEAVFIDVYKRQELSPLKKARPPKLTAKLSKV